MICWCVMSVAMRMTKIRGLGGFTKLLNWGIMALKITDGIIWPLFVKRTQTDRKIQGRMTHIVIKKRGERRWEGKQPHMTN